MTVSAIPTPAEARREAEGRTTPEEDFQAVDDPRMKDEYSFMLDMKDSRGKIWRGEFTNKILSLGDTQKVGFIKARMCGGLPLESFDAFTLNLNEQLAHLEVSLIKRPKWAENLAALKDQAIVDAIYQEVAAHEATFRGPGPDQASSASRG